MKFRELLNLLEVLFPDRLELEPAAERVFERIIGHLIRKVSKTWSFRAKYYISGFYSIQANVSEEKLLATEESELVTGLVYNRTWNIDALSSGQK